MRERLIELLKQGRKEYSRQGIASALKLMEGKDWCNRREDIVCGELEFLADYLLENGVVVPPVKLNQPCFELCSYSNEIDDCKVSSITQKADGSLKVRLTNLRYKSVWEITPDKIGKTVFLSREAAENALKEREKG